MFLGTTSEGDSFSCLCALSLEIPFQKILKITYNHNIKRICRLGLYVYKIIYKLASSLNPRKAIKLFLCVRKIRLVYINIEQ